MEDHELLDNGLALQQQQVQQPQHMHLQQHISQQHLMPQIQQQQQQHHPSYQNAYMPVQHHNISATSSPPITGVEPDCPCYFTPPLPERDPHAHLAHAKVPKAETEDILDVRAIKLPAEDENGHGVPLYDDCEEVRRKIDVFLDTHDITKAKFTRYLAGQTVDTLLNATQVAVFMNKRGFHEGAGSKVYYLAYVLFEKMRIRDGGEKGENRIRNERMRPEGLPRTSGPGCAYAKDFKNAMRVMKHTQH